MLELCIQAGRLSVREVGDEDASCGNITWCLHFCNAATLRNV